MKLQRLLPIAFIVLLTACSQGPTGPTIPQDDFGPRPLPDPWRDDVCLTAVGNQPGWCGDGSLPPATTAPVYGPGLSTGSRGRDLVGELAAHREEALQNAAALLADRYALTAEKSMQVARTLRDWSELRNNRARSEADIAEFSERLYGVKYSDLKAAAFRAYEGDFAPMNESISQVARNWGTNEELVRQMLTDFYGR